MSLLFFCHAKFYRFARVPSRCACKTGRSDPKSRHAIDIVFPIRQSLFLQVRDECRGTTRQSATTTTWEVELRYALAIPRVALAILLPLASMGLSLGDFDTAIQYPVASNRRTYCRFQKIAPRVRKLFLNMSFTLGEEPPLTI